MKRYRLLKDLPTFKAGDLFYISEYGALVHNGGDPDGYNVMAYAQSTLEKFPNILTEWFEEIQEESTDSIHWMPKQDEKIWYLDENGDTNFTYFDEDNPYHCRRIEFGNAYRTSQECEEARERKLAEVRLRRTSTFKPDFYNSIFVYSVGYDCSHKRLYVTKLLGVIIGNPITYESLEEAEKSIKENREDWLIYFGIDPSDNEKQPEAATEQKGFWWEK